MSAQSLVLGTLLAALFALRLMRLREQRARRMQVRWIVEDQEVGSFLATLAGDYLLTPQEVRARFVTGGVIALLGAAAFGRLVSVLLGGPRTNAVLDFTRRLTVPPPIAVGLFILGVGLLASYWSTRTVLRIQPEYVEEQATPFGSWRLGRSAIARVGREFDGQGALVFETTSGGRRAFHVVAALREALGNRPE